MRNFLLKYLRYRDLNQIYIYIAVGLTVPD